jgi:hypothetical protein
LLRAQVGDKCKVVVQAPGYKRRRRRIVGGRPNRGDDPAEDRPAEKEIEDENRAGVSFLFPDGFDRWNEL